MKPATAKTKGRETENIAVTFLRQWWPDAERKRLKGVKDEGDITGIGYRVIEVKSGARLSISQWMKELQAERLNFMQDVWHRIHPTVVIPELPPGMLVIRPSGKPNPEDWWALMSFREACELWSEEL